MEWWNDKFFFRKNLTILPIENQPIDVGHPITVVLNWRSMIDANKVRTNFEDIAIIRQFFLEDGEEDLEEVDRRVEIVDDEVIITFNTEYQIVDEPNNEYYIYYGNTLLRDYVPANAHVNSDYVISVSYNNIAPTLTFSKPGEDWVAGRSEESGARAALNFEGVHARIVMEGGPDRGIYEIRVNDGEPFTVDTYNTQYTDIITTIDDYLTKGFNAIRIRVLGSKNPSSSSNMIIVKSFDYSNYIEAFLNEEEILTKWSPINGSMGV